MDREILQLLKYQSDLENKEANVTLVDLIQSKDEDFQYQVANKLRGLQWIPEEEKVKVLFNILTCNWEEVSKMGKAAYDQLVTALHHKNQDVRNNAMKALGVIGDKKALIPLIDLLMEPTIGIKKKACETILKIEPDWKKSPLLRDPLNKYFKEEEKRKMAQKEAEREKRAERRAEREKRMENLWPKINKVPNLNKIFKLYDCYATIKSTELKQKLDELRIEEPDTVSRFYRDYQGPNVKEGNLELTLGALINCIVDDMQPFNREFRVDIRKTLGVDSEFDNWSFEWISVKTITGDVHVISRFGKDIYAMFVHDNKTF